MKNIKGFSLIEVLVTLLLTTIGILGMVALQGRSIQYTQDSAQRNAAVELANDFIEITRANPQELFDRVPPAFPMNSSMKSSSSLFKEEGDDFDNRKACVINATTISSTAAEQRDCWAERVEKTLPGGATTFAASSYICRSAAPGECTAEGSMVEISLAWDVRAGSCLDEQDTNASICTYTVRFQP